MDVESLSVLDLPDIFMISVFQKFTLKDLLKCARVCKKWNQLIRDGSLWRRLDLTDFKSSLTTIHLEKVISVYASESTRSLSLLGNYIEDSHSDLTDKYSPIVGLNSSFVNQILLVKSPGLTHLSLQYLDLTDISFDMICGFKNLEILSISWCNLTDEWFKNSPPDPHTHLKHLYLVRCNSSMLKLADVEKICSTAPALKTLCINQSQSSLRDDSVEIIVNRLKQLENLSLNNTLITDQAVYSICESASMCVNLKTLNLARSSSLSNRCLEPIGSSLVNLKSLHLTSCFGISNVLALASFAQLNYLNLNNTSIDKEKIRQCLVPTLSKCEIEFGHEKMLNRKLMWTINGSRNCVCSF